MTKKDDALRNVSFRITEKEFPDPEEREMIRAFFNAQSSKQRTIAMMAHFFIEHVGYEDLTSYRTQKSLHSSQMKQLMMAEHGEPPKAIQKQTSETKSPPDVSHTPEIEPVTETKPEPPKYPDVDPNDF
jgi:hypothetical protein